VAVERIVGGFLLAEAPVALADGSVVFSDAIAGGVHRWDPHTGDVGIVVAKRRGIGGMAVHTDGGLVMSGRDLVHVQPDGTTRVVLADDTIAGFNDLTVDGTGRVVVATLRFHPFAGESPVPGEFTRVDDGGRTATVMAPVDWGNGCAFSPDGATFYGCDYQHGVVLAAECHGDGTYGEPRVVVRSPSNDADGLAVDDTGALWVALGAGGAVGRFRPDGALDTTLEVDADFVSSVCFGAPGELFVTTAGSAAHPDAGGLHRVEVDANGAPLTAANV
jgi:gluconolactonase